MLARHREREQEDKCDAGGRDRAPDHRRRERGDGDRERQVDRAARHAGQHLRRREVAEQQRRLIPGGERAEQVGDGRGGRVDSEPRRDQLPAAGHSRAQEDGQARTRVEGEGSGRQHHDEDQAQ